MRGGRRREGARSEREAVGPGPAAPGSPAPGPERARRPWWQSAVFYQIYPRSFCDTTGNGVGDLEGVRRHLDHLVWLGVDALWLSPFFRSPMKDYGYDVSDHCDVDPLFGTLADFDRLLADAHARGLRVLLDWVPNHTSDQHPWFLASRASRTSPRRDWYVWRDGTPDRPPNNWRAAFGRGAPAWTWDEATRQWYLHLFLREQPDLHWGNPAVVSAMHDTLRFWLDRGVDGFRMDVVHCIGKDPALPDLPPAICKLPACVLNDDTRTHALLRDIRKLFDAYDERVMVGEVYLLSTERVATYYGDGDELHLAFNFPPLHAPWEAAAWARCIDDVRSWVDARGAWPTWVLSNHDNPRHRTRYGSEARARAAALLLLTLRGAPFLFAGEELGLEDAVVTAERVRDPGGRDGCRAPIPWEAEAPHGWASDDPWLPWPPHASARCVAAQREDPHSMLGLYRRLLAARRASPALRTGDFAWLPAPEGVLAFRRCERDDVRVVALDFAGSGAALPLEGRFAIERSSDGEAEGEAYRGRLAPGQGLLLRPA